MAHEVYWMKPNRVLYANYKGYHDEETIRACLDDMATELDKVDEPVFVLINWLEVTGHDPAALIKHQKHRAYGHPMAARAVLVGMGAQAQMENQVSATRAREIVHTVYFDTMEEALHYLEFVLADDPNPQ
ncbi:MAG: hypothetical protein D6737_08840 [Chloroflexi bacterium]|nr:MAG: hypothetical protein D6737_08840 [Chloroflexota bacterium]